MQELADIVIGVGKKVDNLEVCFDSLEGRFDGLEGRFDGLEVCFDSLETKLTIHDSRFDAIDARFDGLENKLDERIDELAGITMRGFSEVNARIDTIDERLESVEGTVVIMGQTLDDTRSDVKALVCDSTKLKTRVEDIEIHTFGSIRAS